VLGVRGERARPPGEALRVERDAELVEVGHRLVNLAEDRRTKVARAPDEDGEVAKLGEEGEGREEGRADVGEEEGLDEAEGAEREEGRGRQAAENLCEQA